MKEYLSQYENEYGERWIFTYDYSIGLGVVTGSDVSGKHYKVIDGRATGLLLNDGELNWLRRSWINAVKAIEVNSGGAVDSLRNQEEISNFH